LAARGGGEHRQASMMPRLVIASLSEGCAGCAAAPLTGTRLSTFSCSQRAVCSIQQHASVACVATTSTSLHAVAATTHATVFAAMVEGAVSAWTFRRKRAPARRRSTLANASTCAAAQSCLCSAVMPASASSACGGQVSSPATCPRSRWAALERATSCAATPAARSHQPLNSEFQWASPSSVSLSGVALVEAVEEVVVVVMLRAAAKQKYAMAVCYTSSNKIVDTGYVFPYSGINHIATSITYIICHAPGISIIG